VLGFQPVNASIHQRESVETGGVDCLRADGAGSQAGQFHRDARNRGPRSVADDARQITLINLCDNPATQSEKNRKQLNSVHVCVPFLRAKYTHPFAALQAEWGQLNGDLAAIKNFDNLCKMTPHFPND
jgi:hypothetical protein